MSRHNLLIAALVAASLLVSGVWLMHYASLDADRQALAADRAALDGSVAAALADGVPPDAVAPRWSCPGHPACPPDCVIDDALAVSREHMAGAVRMTCGYLRRLKDAAADARGPCADALYTAALAEWGWLPGPEQLVLEDGQRRTSAYLPGPDGKPARGIVRTAGTLSGARWALLDDLTGFYREATALKGEGE